MNYENHARAIAGLPAHTREIVLDAIRVRAMDFVADKLTDGPADDCASIYRATFPDADAAMAFDPFQYLMVKPAPPEATP